MELCSFILKLPIILLNFLKNYFDKIKNLVCRPTVELELGLEAIGYKNANGSQKIIYPFLILKNKSSVDIQLKPGSIKFNQNVPYINFFPLSDNYLSSITFIDEYASLLESYQAIKENRSFMMLGAYKELRLPLNIITENIYIIEGSNKKSKLFYSDSKLEISLLLNHQTYFYAIKKYKLYPVIVNYLMLRIKRYEQMLLSNRYK